MKKKILLAAAIVICMAIGAAGTLAYFTAEDTAHNVITSGNVKIELVEQTQDGDGNLTDFPKEGIHGIMPGAQVSKIVRVKNTGKNEAWIRVRVEAQLFNADGSSLPQETPSGAPVLDFTMGENWHMDFDGYLYYAKPLAAGESTEVLFDTVRFAPEMDNAYQNCTANLVISAQAVQTANNGDTVTQAADWPDGK